MNPEQFKTQLDINLNQQQLTQFELFYDDLITTNQQFNLTSITEKEDVYLKHYFDSLTVLQRLPSNPFSLIDVGAGAGFPSIPIKIVRPDISLTMVDSLGKRVDFLNREINQLQLENALAIHGRAEDFGQDPNYRQQFDVAIGRAVASISILLEYLVPLVKVDGQIILMKGDWQKTEAELEIAENSLKVLDCSVDAFEKISLPNQDQRSILVIKKNKVTNKKYPRKAGTPSKMPL